MSLVPDPAFPALADPFQGLSDETQSFRELQVGQLVGRLNRAGVAVALPSHRVGRRRPFSDPCEDGGAFSPCRAYFDDAEQHSGFAVSAEHDVYDDAIRSAMAELAQCFADSTSIEDTLARVTAAAVDLIPGVDFADLLLIQDGDSRSTAATSGLAVTLDESQLSAGEGPCLDAAGSARVIRCDDLLDDQRWPEFARAAIAVGVHGMLCYQLYTHEANTGAMNLFSFGARTFDDESEAIGAMLATHAAIALITANRKHQFESALASRDIIGQAKGIIMERYDLDAIRAFELLTRISQNANTPVKEIAREIVEGPRRRLAVSEQPPGPAHTDTIPPP